MQLNLSTKKRGSLPPSPGGASSNEKEFVRQSFRFNLKNELESKVYENKFSIFDRTFYLRLDISGCIKLVT